LRQSGPDSEDLVAAAAPAWNRIRALKVATAAPARNRIGALEVAAAAPTRYRIAALTQDGKIYRCSVDLPCNRE